ncbi:putative amino acid efflux protein, partial [Bordetella avium 197N]
VETGMLLSFWIVSLSLVIVPGPDWAYVISAGLRHRAIAPALGGMLSGYMMITLLTAAGIGALVVSEPRILTLLSVVGAAYLLWLGAGKLKHPAAAVSSGAGVQGSWRAWAARGFLVSGVNPKVLLLYLALLPQFTTRDSAWPIATQITVLGLVQILNCALVYSLVGAGAKTLLGARPEAARRVGQFSGVAMIVIALMLLAEQLI